MSATTTPSAPAAASRMRRSFSGDAAIVYEHLRSDSITPAAGA